MKTWMFLVFSCLVFTALSQPQAATAVLGKIQEPQYMVSPDYQNWQGVLLMKAK